MPAPSFVANSTFATSTGSLTMTLPAGYAVNDILVLCIETANNTGAGQSGIPTQGQTNLTNNGWARVTNSNTSLLSPTVSASQNVLMDIWWTRASSTSQTAVVLGDSGDHTMSVCAAFRNVITTGDPWNATINVTQTSASSQVTSRNVTTSEANTLVLTVLASPRDAAAAHINASAQLLINNSDGTELTEIFDYGTTTGNGGTLGALTFRKPSAGATPNVRANTVTSNVAILWTGALIGTADPTSYPHSFAVVF